MSYTFATTLECSHCGDVAHEDEDGVFAEDDGDACMSCGFPGGVSIETGFDEQSGEDIDRAWWNTSDASDAVCSRADCEECVGIRVAFGLPAASASPQVTNAERPER